MDDDRSRAFHPDWGIRAYPAPVRSGRRVLATATEEPVMLSSDTPRSFLPTPEGQHGGLVTYDAKAPDPSFPPITPLRPPAGAPNVLVILLDDAGFGSSSAFGGPC